MKNLLVPILVVVCAGCPSRPPPFLDDENLKSGEVTQLAFTGDGKHLVVVNEFKVFIDYRKKCHSRLRSFSTSDWTTSGDTGEMSVVGLNCAPSAEKSTL
jgi:hypothetical protein